MCIQNRGENKKAAMLEASNRILKLNQANHITDLLTRAGMQDCSSEPTPVASGAIFTKQDCPAPGAIQDQDQIKQAKWYRSVVASCIHLSVWTRPDIAFAVSKLCKFMSNPGPVHVMIRKVAVSPKFVLTKALVCWCNSLTTLQHFPLTPSFHSL